MRSRWLSWRDAGRDRRPPAIAPLSAAEYPRARQARDDVADALRHFQPVADVVGLAELEDLCDALTAVVGEYETRAPSGRLQRLRLAWRQARRPRLDDVLDLYGVDLGLFAVGEEASTRQSPLIRRRGRSTEY